MTTGSEETRLLTKREAAGRLGISLRSVDYLMQRGGLRFVRLSPRVVRFRPGDLEAFVKARVIESGR